MSLLRVAMAAQAYIPPAPLFVGGGGFSQGSNSSGGSFTMTGGLSGGLSSSPAIGDTVVIAVSACHGSDIAMDVTGYVEETDIFAGGINFGVYHKKLTAADTAFTVSLGAFVSALSGSVSVWRGVADVVIDAPAATATDPSTGQPNCPSIAPFTENAIILALGGAAGPFTSSLVALTSPSGMSNFYGGYASVGSGTRGKSAAGIASFLRTSLLPYDPAAFGGGSTGTDCCSAMTTLALRPQ